MFDLEISIQAWSDRLRSRGKMSEGDVQELESHLRDEIEDLTQTGLAPDEAYIISIKRLGNVSAVSEEYAKLGMASFWKHLLLEQPAHKTARRKALLTAAVCALLAGTAFKLPELLGCGETLYFKNAGLFLLPLIALYFLLTKRQPARSTAWTLGLFGLSGLLINLYPFDPSGSTITLSAIHLPLFLWLLVGVAYCGARWKESESRMDFIRLTGETLIYGILILCGVGALAVFVLMIFHTIGIDLSRFVTEYLAVYGACAAAFAAVYLVEEKKSVVENFAPVLAKIFSPLFLLALLAFLAALLLTGKHLYADRDVLIGFDLMLALVLGLVVYGISARGLNENPDASDYIRFALILAAFVVDLLALFAILYRLSAYGVTPNKLAALGENLILMGNLGGLAVRYFQFFRRKTPFSALERWQTFYLWVFAVWLAIVALLFPVLFQYC
ncbi:MAG: permease prefix domain 1-containing protein [Oscillospiraceae bacterium]|nr:permease prefix domain 1-containing protein [Oscillospiraceae bacterium]